MLPSKADGPAETAQDTVHAKAGSDSEGGFGLRLATKSKRVSGRAVSLRPLPSEIGGRPGPTWVGVAEHGPAGNPVAQRRLDRWPLIRGRDSCKDPLEWLVVSIGIAAIVGWLNQWLHIWSV